MPIIKLNIKSSCYPPPPPSFQLSTSVTHLDGSSFRDDDSGVELELASRNSSSDRDVARQQAPLPHAVHEDKGEGLGRRAHHQQQQQQQKPFHFSDVRDKYEVVVLL